MARQTNDSEPTCGEDIGGKPETEPRSLNHYSGAPAGQLSSEGDEPPLVRVRLSEDGSHTIEETLSPSGDVVSSRTTPV